MHARENFEALIQLYIATDIVFFNVLMHGTWWLNSKVIHDVEVIGVPYTVCYKWPVS